MHNSSLLLVHKGFCREYSLIIITGQHLKLITAVAHIQVHCAI